MGLILNTIQKLIELKEFSFKQLLQGIGIKGKEMALVWHEKASRTALQTSTVTLHTLF